MSRTKAKTLKHRSVKNGKGRKKDTETSGNISYTVSYTYDANGNILTVTDESGTVTREYDALNRVTKYIDALGNVILYEYDSCGNLSKMTYPNGEQGVYTYDANHNMISTSLANSTYTISYEYNKQNQITKIYRPDGSICTKSYDRAGRLTNSTDLDVNGDFVVVDSYIYDSLGRLKEEINLATFSRYIMEYDSLDRLVKRTEKDLRYNSFRNEETFTYDAAGNILTDSDGNTFTYTENNVIKTANGTTYFTDAKGNSTWTPTEKFVSASFDLRNRLTAASSNKYQYTYDAENNRVSMTYETTSMQYTHDTSDGRNRLIWTKDQDNVETIYGYGADGIVWSLCNGEYKFYHYDYRGSVKAVTSIDGTITDTIKYDVYGCVEERTGESELIIGYNGEYGVLSDPNGLLYMRTRYYNPSLKRFLSADIITGSISDSTTLNLYAYVNGNPITFIDPFGLAADRAQNNIYDIYTKEEIESNASKKIMQNAENIKYAAEVFLVDENIIAAVIFVEQYFNYDWKDVATDWISFYGFIDMSVGLGQVRLSTAEYIEERGYMPKTEASEGGWNIPLIGFVHGTETMAREKRLENDAINILYVAAYLKTFQDDWSSEYPLISSSPEILGTLYNIGHLNKDGSPREPHSSPEPTWFGENTKKYYDLMTYLLGA